MQAKLIKTISTAKSQLKIDEEDWRNLILPRFGGKEINGKVSLKSLSIEQMQALLEELRSKGFEKPAGTKPFDQLAYIRLLWKELHQMGIVKNPSEKAIIAWAKHYFEGLDCLEWLNVKQKIKLIQALKDWKKRGK